MKKGKKNGSEKSPNRSDERRRGDNVDDGDSRKDDETTMNRVSTTAPTTTRDETITSMITTVHSSTSTSVTSRTTPLLSTGEIPTSTFALQSVPPRDTQTGPNVVILVTLPAVLLVVIALLVIWSIRKKSIVRLQQRRNPVYTTDSDGVNMKGMEGASPTDQYEEVNENIPEAKESSTKKTAETTPFYQTLEPDMALNGIVTSHKDVDYDQVDREAHSRMIDNEDINRAAGYDRLNLTSESTSYDIVTLPRPWCEIRSRLESRITGTEFCSEINTQAHKVVAPSQPPRSASASTTKMPSTTRPVSQNPLSSDVTTGPLTELYEEVETPNNKSLKLGLGVGISLFAGFFIVAVFLLMKRWRNRRSISRKDNGKNLHTKIYLGKSPKTGVSDTDGRMSLQTHDYATLNFPEDQRVSSRHPDSFYQLLESDTDRLPMVAVNTSRHNEMSRDEDYDKLVRQGDPSLINNVNKQTDLDYQATRPKHNNGYDHVERIFPSQAIEISDHEYSVATNPTATTDQSYDHLDRQVTARSTKDDMVVSSSTYDVLESVNDDRTKQDIQSLNKSQINDPHQYETTLIKQIGNVNG